MKNFLSDEEWNEAVYKFNLAFVARCRIICRKLGITTAHHWVGGFEEYNPTPRWAIRIMKQLRVVRETQISRLQNAPAITVDYHVEQAQLWKDDIKITFLLVHNESTGTWGVGSRIEQANTVVERIGGIHVAFTGTSKSLAALLQKFQYNI